MYCILTACRKYQWRQIFPPGELSRGVGVGEVLISSGSKGWKGSVVFGQCLQKPARAAWATAFKMCKFYYLLHAFLDECASTVWTIGSHFWQELMYCFWHMHSAHYQSYALLTNFLKTYSRLNDAEHFFWMLVFVFICPPISHYSPNNP